MQTYDSAKSYLWNYENAPETSMPASDAPVDLPARFLGVPTTSELGVAAGPLLNGRWVLHYAALGYGVLTYKTVRSKQRDCYPLPNLVPVGNAPVPPNSTLSSKAEMEGSWAISFGMPSFAPTDWTRDIHQTRQQLPPGRVLNVSVVATPQADWSLEQVAQDYALCARLAAESGADCIEANFSCPNVGSVDGQLYQRADDARYVAKQIREAIGDKPLALKIGHVSDAQDARRLVGAVEEFVDGLSMVNCIAARVRQTAGPPSESPLLHFDGQPRGIGGTAILDQALAQVELFAGLAEASQLDIIGVGGASRPEDVQRFLSAGAAAVHVATAAMTHPSLAEQYLRLRH
ncbi:MAG TPA: hypothetical protein DDW52_28205 [Planctomycetaceae bacterium]|nr:hypothetical protein [Planctomycetaceae bacterium]